MTRWSRSRPRSNLSQCELKISDLSIQMVKKDKTKNIMEVAAPLSQTFELVTLGLRLCQPNDRWPTSAIPRRIIRLPQGSSEAPPTPQADSRAHQMTQRPFSLILSPNLLVKEISAMNVIQVSTSYQIVPYSKMSPLRKQFQIQIRTT